MKRTLWTMATTGLLAICMTSCGGGGGGGGGGKDYATEACNKMQACGDLSLVDGATTVSECKAAANQHLNAMSSSDRAAYEKGFDQCLAFSDCATSEACGKTAPICFNLEGCNALSLMGNSTTVADCITYAIQQLVALSSSQGTRAAQALNACVAVESDCTSLGACVSALTTP